jgi:hypothetical protein
VADHIAIPRITSMLDNAHAGGRESQVSKDRFRNFVQGAPPAQPHLPLTHLTDAYRFENARLSDELQPRGCKVFGEPLLYLFYGRPSYRVHPDEQASGLEHYLPVCLLFKNEGMPPPKRVFPFDSGAFAAGRYADAVHRDMALEDFCLEADPNTPGRVISLFFGSVEAYCLANPVTGVPLPVTEFEARSYAALVASQLRSNTDDRGSAIELQIDASLRLSAYAEAVVAPGPLLDDPDVRAFLEAHGIERLPYEQLGRQRPSDFVSDLFRICREYYRRRGLLPSVP